MQSDKQHYSCLGQGGDLKNQKFATPNQRCNAITHELKDATGSREIPAYVPTKAVRAACALDQPALHHPRPHLQHNKLVLESYARARPEPWSLEHKNTLRSWHMP